MKTTQITCRNCKSRFLSSGSSFCSGQCFREKQASIVRFYPAKGETFRKVKKRLPKKSTNPELIKKRRLEIENSNLRKQVRALKQKKDTDGFYETRAWAHLRYEALRVYGRKCSLCGTTAGEMHVDHIKPRSKNPELALVFGNLQVLCRDCNMGKSNKDETDWRLQRSINSG
jgi:5-methylcytosine-specific restriction endonuclease McrA